MNDEMTEEITRKEALEMFITALAAKPSLLIDTNTNGNAAATELIEGAKKLMEFINQKPSA